MATCNSIDSIECKFIKDIISLVEKKKRNLEKRKHKLEEYKDKDNLNEDQKLALSKADCVSASIEVLEEISKLVAIQAKEASTNYERAIQSDELSRYKRESELLAVSIKSYLTITNFCRHLNRSNVQQQGLLRNALGLSDAQTQLLEKLYKFHIDLSKSDIDNKDVWSNVAHNLICLHDAHGEFKYLQPEDRNTGSNKAKLISPVNTKEAADKLLSCRISSCFISSDRINIDDSTGNVEREQSSKDTKASDTKSEPETVPNKLVEVLQPLQGAFNFIHSSCVTSSNSVTQVGTLQTTSHIQSGQNLPNVKVVRGLDNGQNSFQQANNPGVIGDQKQRAAMPNNNNGPLSNAVNDESVQSKSNDVKPTPLMELDPITTLSVENSLVLAGLADGIDHSRRTKSNKFNGKFNSTSKQRGMRQEDPAILSIGNTKNRFNKKSSNNSHFNNKIPVNSTANISNQFSNDVMCTDTMSSHQDGAEHMNMMLQQPSRPVEAQDLNSAAQDINSSVVEYQRESSKLFDIFSELTSHNKNGKINDNNNAANGNSVPMLSNDQGDCGVSMGTSEHDTFMNTNVNNNAAMVSNHNPVFNVEPGRQMTANFDSIFEEVPELSNIDQNVSRASTSMNINGSFHPSSVGVGNIPVSSCSAELMSEKLSLRQPIQQQTSQQPHLPHRQMAPPQSLIMGQQPSAPQSSFLTNVGPVSGSNGPVSSIASTQHQAPVNQFNHQFNHQSQNDVMAQNSTNNGSHHQHTPQAGTPLTLPPIGSIPSVFHSGGITPKPVQQPRLYTSINGHTVLQDPSGPIGSAAPMTPCSIENKKLMHYLNSLVHNGHGVGPNGNNSSTTNSNNAGPVQSAASHSMPRCGAGGIGQPPPPIGLTAPPPLQASLPPANTAFPPLMGPVTLSPLTHRHPAPVQSQQQQVQSTKRDLHSIGYGHAATS